MVTRFNDEAAKIVYMYYYFDIDYIADANDNFEAEMYRLVDTAFWANSK